MSNPTDYSRFVSGHYDLLVKVPGANSRWPQVAVLDRQSAIKSHDVALRDGIVAHYVGTDGDSHYTSGDDTRCRECGAAIDHEVGGSFCTADAGHVI